MRRLPIRALCAPLAVMLVLATGGALAQSKGDAGEAARLFSEGRKLLEQGQFEAALGKLEPSLALQPSPNTELLRAHALRQVGRRAEAMDAYERTMVTAGERVGKGEKRFVATLEEAGRWSALLRGELSQVDLILTAAPENVSIAVDGRAAKASRQGEDAVLTQWHEPGSVEIRATTPDGRVLVRKDKLVAGARARITMSYADATAPIDDTPPSPSPEPPRDGGIRAPPVGSFIAAGVGVAGFAVFGIFGAMSSSTASDLDACSPRCPASLREEADAGSRNQTIANIGLIAGAAGFAAAGVLWIVSAQLDDGKGTSAAIGPGWAGVRRSF